jgi:hypothetical protein
VEVQSVTLGAMRVVVMLAGLEFRAGGAPLI